MKKNFLMIVVSLVLSLLIVQVITPAYVLAEVGAGSPSSSCTSGATAGSATGITNPLKVNSIECLISEAIKFVVNLLAIAGVIYLIWTGLLFVTAQGDPKKLEVAKKSFVNAIIGMAIILGAWAIATVVANTINKVTGGNVTLPPQS